MVCVGAGPWKEKQRAEVQQSGINWLNGKDLSEIKRVNKVYPFEWQNNMVKSMVKSLKQEEETFVQICRFWKKDKNIKTSIINFFDMCGVSENGTKVLWLFIRDHLNLPAFPIDRWVARNLDKKGLPKNSWEMVDLCEQANVNPNVLSRYFFQSTNPTFK